VYWRVRGHSAEGAGVLRTLLDAPAAQGSTLPRARALAAAAHLLDQAEGYGLAADYCQEALAIARAAGEEDLVAELLYEQSWALLRQGEPGAALPLIESALGLARRLGELHLTGRLLSARSYARYIAGDAEGGARDAAEALPLSRQAGDRLHVGQMLGNLGSIELSAGDLAAARGHVAESLEIFRSVNDRDGIAYQTFNLGLAEYLGGSPSAAETLFAESLDLARRMGMKRQTAYALIGLAMAGHDRTDPGWSARVHGAADRTLADLGEIIEPLEGRLADLDRERLRAVLGDEAFDAEYAAGRTLDSAQVVAGLGRQDTAAGQARAAGADVTVLTPRELDVLKLVAQGLSNPDIARRLFLSEHTVHRHLANILRKLGLSSRAAAAAWGVRTGLV
jgi:DNA-binding CsgD family transcriptional regulator/tetratricopeptide (TPR) repeat protein